MLQHWLSAVQHCTQLSAAQLYIVCNPAELADFQACLQRHQQQNTLVACTLVPAQLGSSAAPNHLAGLTTLAAAQPLPDLLIVLDGACLCEPGFSLQRFVQHTLTRNADMVSFSPAALPEVVGSTSAWVQLQDSSINPRVIDISQECRLSLCCPLGPVYGLYQSTLKALLQQASATRLQDALQLKLQHTPLYASPVQCSFDLSSLEGYLYADAYFTFCQQQWALLHGPMLSAVSAASISSPQQQLQVT